MLQDVLEDVIQVVGDVNPDVKTLVKVELTLQPVGGAQVHVVKNVQVRALEDVHLHVQLLVGLDVLLDVGPDVNQIVMVVDLDAQDVPDADHLVHWNVTVGVLMPVQELV